MVYVVYFATTRSSAAVLINIKTAEWKIHENKIYLYVCICLSLCLCPDVQMRWREESRVYSVQCTALIIIPLIIELLPPLTFTFTYSLGVD